MFVTCNMVQLCITGGTAGHDPTAVAAAGLQLHMVAGTLAVLHRSLRSLSRERRSCSPQLLEKLKALGTAGEDEGTQQQDAMHRHITETKASISCLLDDQEFSAGGVWSDAVKVLLTSMGDCLGEVLRLRHLKQAKTDLPGDVRGWVDDPGPDQLDQEDEKDQVRKASKCSAKTDSKNGNNSPQSLEMKQVIARKSRAKSWDFDALKVARDHGCVLRIIGMHLLIPSQVLSRSCTHEFLEALEDKYKSNPYHSNAHAADMTNSFSFMLSACAGIVGNLSSIRQASMFVAALSHDVGHSGFNNVFHVSASHELAVTYNDISVLENFHASEMVRLLMQSFGASKKRLFARVSQSQFNKEKKFMIRLILSTDISKLVGDLADLRLALDSSKFDPVEQVSDQETALTWLFRASDIGHAAKPWNLHQAWSERITQEFHEQGDEEKRLGLPVSPLCEREGFDMAKSQIGFLQFVCIPTFTQLARLPDTLNSHEPKRSVSLGSKQVPAINRTKPKEHKLKVKRMHTFDAVLTTKVHPESAMLGDVSSTQDADNEALRTVCLAHCEENLMHWKDMLTE